MALTSVPSLQGLPGLPASWTTPQLQQAVDAAEAVVRAYCKRNFDPATYMSYVSGNGMQHLPLRQRPVLVQTFTGTTTNGSPVVTGISSTATLWAGSATSGSGIPAGTTVTSVDSSSQVTLSSNATAGGSTTLAFGPAVYLDPAGWAGRGPNAFSSASLLREGFDYLLDYGPDDNLSSKSGCLIRLGGGISGTTLDAIWPWEWRKGTLTVRLPPVWPQGLKNVKVVYRAGYAAPPADLTAATNQIAVWLLRTGYLGGRMLSSENWNGYGYALSALQQRPELGEARQVLGRYRELAV